jgi:arsenate reductase
LRRPPAAAEHEAAIKAATISIYQPDDPDYAMNVLFLCTGNSCRSLISEAVFNHLAPAGWHAISAGSQPTGKLNERALALLTTKGIPTDGYYSKSWDNLAATPDVVVTVCAGAAGETCPAYLGPVLRAHWGVEDPSHVVGTDDEIGVAFEQAYAILRARIEAFLALPLDELKADPAALKAEFKAELDRIGHIGA